MLRRIFIVASCVTMLVLSALPAVAATSSTHVFSIPGVYGVRAWGTYYETGIRVRVSVCVEDTAPSVGCVFLRGALFLGVSVMRRG
jgi:hypothetical protein